MLLALSFEQGTGIREGKQGNINSPALVAESAGTVVVDG